ncbi:HAMP domain-containing sensor histidine kinase [Paenibacillus sp. HB172176]|uniref:sensor histidine kinase n=1 Tax=Paenibacillus sp. HB172176 TaxID=2493690 RepID=UPI00143C14CC|nr:HAMP domain-containing sensor histidine kinase [Paenibacillus sp. HB172176]
MSYLAMAFVPVVLLMLIIIFVLLTGDRQDLRELTSAQKNENFNQALIYGELSYVLREDTEQLQNPAFVENLQERLREQWAGVLITKNDQLTNVSPFLREQSQEENWEEVAANPKESYAFKRYRYTTHTIAFTYGDGSKGEVILLHRSNPVPIFWHPLSMLILAIIICLTSLILTYLMSRSIIRPIHQLRTAALRIKDGDLTYEPPRKRRKRRFGGKKMSELDQLSSAFEEMRMRLKHSIDQSLLYEENRKLLLSHISHDLKTPISAIRGYVEGILDGIANTEEKKERYMRTIYRKAADMDQLIDELFLFSKLDLQKIAYDFKVIDLCRYTEHVMEEQRFELDKEHVQLTYIKESEGELWIAADPEKLNRVFMNILSNSVKYMSNDPGAYGKRSITVTLTEQPRHAVIRIADTGPGIDEGDLPFIFDRFYRAEQSRNSETGGSGLGLAIVKQIVEGHGGEVYAENRSQGGACFTLRLPKSTDVKAVNEHEESIDY